MKNYLALFFAIIPVSLLAQQNAYVSPAGTKFLLYTPPGYDTSTEPYPLLVSLHGKGEWGDDLTKLTSGNSTGMPSRLIYLNKWPQNYQFIVLTPQYNPPNPDEPNPIWPPSHIDEVLNYVLANWRIKTYRVYITGLSFGANATWNYIAAYPQKVAAIVPISGRADLTKACLVKDIPAWVFHGDNDPTATSAYSVDMVNAIDNCVPAGAFNQKLTTLYSKNHEGWNEVYNGTNGYNIFDWMMRFTKGSSSNVPPFVNAGPDLTMKQQSQPIYIAGGAFDFKGQIIAKTWRQVAGTPLTLSNVNDDILRVSNFQPGTFELELSAKDNSGATTADKMVLKIVSSSTLPTVNKLILVNGETNADVREISQGMVIDKNALGLSHVNVRAETSSNTQSVRFGINTNRNTRTVNSPGPFLIKSPQSTRPEWEIVPGEYVICATPYAGTSAGSGRGVSSSYKVTVIDGVPAPGCDDAGRIFREVWPGVAGKYVTDIPLNTAPAVRGQLFRFEAPTGETGVGDNYGARIRGYICPPQTGQYAFWIASDDRGELWLSTNDNPANKVRIAAVNGYTSSRQWAKYSSQKSSLITLTAGTKYYIEALHKEATLGDHLAVGWQLPNAVLERPIPGFRLIPFGEVEATALFEHDDVLAAEDGFDVYPNPVNQFTSSFSVRAPRNAIAYDHTVVLFSATGAMIQSTSFSRAGSLGVDELQLKAPLPPGIYLVQMIFGDIRYSKKLVVR
jgi:hypothetical protein